MSEDGPMKTTLTGESLNVATVALAEANGAFDPRYPGESAARQSVHSFYGGAHLFRADTAAKLGILALESLDRYAADAATLAKALQHTRRYRVAGDSVNICRSCFQNVTRNEPCMTRGWPLVEVIWPNWPFN